ncbi:MAG: hypothetical protein AAFN93_17040 [Bacteroidota bacterium]
MRVNKFRPAEIPNCATRKILDTVVGDSLNNFLIDKLESSPLGPYVRKAETCLKKENIAGRTEIGGNLHKLDPNDPKIKAAREKWEKDPKIQQEILKDLQTIFEKGKGKKVTKEDLQKLVNLIDKSNKSMEETKKMLEAAREPVSRKLNLEKASTIIESGKVPKQKQKNRKLHKNAQQSNKINDVILGWDPEKFFIRPDIKVDSEEFANTVYDMQEALGIKADGILGADTVIAYYDKNNLKKDFLYKDLSKRRDEERAKRKASKTDTPIEEAPSEEFKTLNGANYTITDKDKGQHIPKSVQINVQSPEYFEVLKGTRNPASVTSVTLDIYIKGIHTYRIQNVAIKSINLLEILSFPDNIPTVWMNLKDGIQITVGKEELILRQRIRSYKR